MVSKLIKVDNELFANVLSNKNKTLLNARAKLSLLLVSIVDPCLRLGLQQTGLVKKCHGLKKFQPDPSHGCDRSVSQSHLS